MKKLRVLKAIAGKATDRPTADIIETHLRVLDQEEPSYVENLVLNDERYDIEKQDEYPKGGEASNEIDPEPDTEPYDEDSNDEEEGLRTLAQLAKDTQAVWRDHLRALRQNPEAIGGKRGPYFGNSGRTRRRRKVDDKINERRGQTTLDLHFKRVRIYLALDALRIGHH